MPTMLSTTTTDKRIFHTLDGMRGVAAITVAMIHYATVIAPLTVKSGYLAVDLFFLMSGFVLDHAYGQKLARIGPVQFLKLRVIRLYPLYLAGILISAIVPAGGLLLGISHGWNAHQLFWSFSPAIFMVPSLPIEGHLPLLYPLDFPAWSLFFELLINAVYAVIARYLSGRLLAWLVAISAVSLVATGAVHGSLNGGWMWYDAWVAPFRVTFAFFAGVLLHRLHRKKRLSAFQMSPILLLAGTVGLLMVDPGAFRVYYDLICAIVIFPVLVWLGANRDPKSGVKIFSTLGTVSYPLYVIHVPCKYMLDRFLDHLLGGKLGAYAPASGLLLLAALAATSYLLATTYDVSARRKLNILSARRAR